MQYMKYGLDTSAGILGVCVRVGADNVKVHGNTVVGDEKPHIEFFTGHHRGRTLVESFINSSAEPETTMRFTSRYGPLYGFCGLTPRGEPRKLRFPLGAWLDGQARAMTLWDSPTAVAEDEILESVQGGNLVRIGGKLHYCCPCVFAFMELEILAIPPDRRWICPRPGCGTRFVREDLKDKYCSAACKTWARNQSKLAWWNRNKEERLAKRKVARSKKRRKRGTRKAR